MGGRDGTAMLGVGAKRGAQSSGVPRMSWWARVAWAPVVKFWQAGAIVVSVGPTAVASRGR